MIEAAQRLQHSKRRRVPHCHPTLLGPMASRSHRSCRSRNCHLSSQQIHTIALCETLASELGRELDTAEHRCDHETFDRSAAQRHPSFLIPTTQHPLTQRSGALTVTFVAHSDWQFFASRCPALVVGDVPTDANVVAARVTRGELVPAPRRVLDRGDIEAGHRPYVSATDIVGDDVTTGAVR